MLKRLNTRPTVRPWGLQWRCSVWFVTLRIANDLLLYSLAIPVFPFQMQRLHITGVSSRVGWLLFSQSCGLVLSTIPVAVLSERYNSRRMPLISGLILQALSQIMLMQAQAYWVMCLARFIQGIGSSLVWIVGLALVCDTTPETSVGRQLGFAMSGLSVGYIIGPPVGGSLYSHFGFRAPFIFGIIVAVLDMVGRLLVIERGEALRWGIDPSALSASHDSITDNNLELLGNSVDSESIRAHGKLGNADNNQPCTTATKPTENGPAKAVEELEQTVSTNTKASVSLLRVMATLFRSSRALVAIFITFVTGVVYSSQEPALPLHLQATWGLDSRKVGLVYLAAIVPTLFSTTLTGWYADRIGTEWITFASLLLALPWWIITIMRSHLALFVVAFAVESFFTAGVSSPITVELAAVSRGTEGIGFAHVYAAFNIAYATGQAVGPIIGGQVYDHLPKGVGWTVLCLMAAGILTVCLLLSYFFTGASALHWQLMDRLKGVRKVAPAAAIDEG